MGSSSRTGARCLTTTSRKKRRCISCSVFAEVCSFLWTVTRKDDDGPSNTIENVNAVHFLITTPIASFSTLKHSQKKKFLYISKRNIGNKFTSLSVDFKKKKKKKKKNPLFFFFKKKKKKKKKS